MGLFDKALHAAQTSNRPGEGALPAEWKTNRVVTLACEPENLEELKAAVDVADPGSVAAYWVYAVTCLTADYDIGMSMMKYLFADLEPFGRSFIMYP